MLEGIRQESAGKESKGIYCGNKEDSGDFLSINLHARKKKGWSPCETSRNTGLNNQEMNQIRKASLEPIYRKFS